MLKFILLATLASPIHEWYPAECCSTTDCELASGVRRDDAGQRWLMPNGETVPYMSTRPTPDGVPGIHWCRFNGKIIYRYGKACVFEPKAGG